jgi:hypothetical protein
MTSTPVSSALQYPRRRRTFVFVLAALASSGCVGSSVQDYERRIAQLERTIEEKDNQLEAKQATIDELHTQLATRLDIPRDMFERVFYPERVVIDGLSGGEDYDGQPGDDGITVYVKPLDKAGDVVKAKGSIRIQLYDLANPPDRNLIGEYNFGPDEAAKLWYGKLMTYHYTLKCPWQHGPPEHTEITIRVLFQDYFTQRVMSAQTTCTVKRSP